MNATTGSARIAVLVCALLGSLVLPACSSAGPSSTVAATPASTALAGDAGAWLPRIEQLPVAGFILIEPPHTVFAEVAAHADARLSATLLGAGLDAAAQERFFRQVGDLAFANGPVDVTATSERYRSVLGAQQAFTALTVWRRAQTGLLPVSAGRLGDQSWSDQEIKPDSGVSAVQITITVRLANAVDELIVRGRAGATGIDDVTVLMRIMLGNQDPRLAPRFPVPTPSAASSGSPAS